MFETINEVKDYLESLPQFAKSGKEAANFDLEHFYKFCTLLGDPQDRINCIHVAGTNGKGSTCRFLASIYQEEGYKTGLYTSPHLLDYKERFRINGNMITDEELLSFFREFGIQVKQAGLTYFEISTAIAFWWFARCGVDLAVIEVGLGGRLDATNVITPLISVITNVSKDHTELLGDEISAIAREKGGIIKNEIPLVIGNLKKEALVEIQSIALEKNAPIDSTKRVDKDLDGNHLILMDHNREEKIALNLEGLFLPPVQAGNITIAFLVTEVLADRYPVSPNSFQKGIRTASTRFKPTGGFERLLPDRSWYFDGAHNVEAVKALKTTIEGLKPINESFLILSLMRDKISPTLMKEFSEFKKIFYHTIDSERAATYSEVIKWLPKADSVPDTPVRNHFLKELTSELVIFTGSFYFYSVVRGWMRNLK